MHAAQLLRRLVDHAVNLLLAGDIGGERDNAPVRLAGQLPRSRLQACLVPRNNRKIDPFLGQFSRNCFADASTPARHDGALALQSEIHGILPSWRRYRSLLASPSIVLPAGAWCKSDAAERTGLEGRSLEAP